jgi:hypothetical protein
VLQGTASGVGEGTACQAVRTDEVESSEREIRQGGRASARRPARGARCFTTFTTLPPYHLTTLPPLTTPLCFALIVGDGGQRRVRGRSSTPGGGGGGGGAGITLHALTALPPYHLTTLPPYHLTTLPPYHLTTLPPYHLTTLPLTTHARALKCRHDPHRPTSWPARTPHVMAGTHTARHGMPQNVDMSPCPRSPFAMP